MANPASQRLMFLKITGLINWARGLITYALKFGVVGLVGVTIDLVVFNAISLLWRSSNDSLLGPLSAKIIAVVISTLFTWVGNRYWTFRAHRRKDYWREAIEFSLVSFGGLLVSVGCLWFSHYVLNFTSLLADNISANVVGFGLATAFRFFLYKYWVYSSHRSEGLSVSHNEAIAGSIVLFEDAASANSDSQHEK